MNIKKWAQENVGMHCLNERVDVEELLQEFKDDYDKQLKVKCIEYAWEILEFTGLQRGVEFTDDDIGKLIKSNCK